VSQVYDYVAFRILTSSVRDWLRGRSHHSFPVEAGPGRIKDFIAMPAQHVSVTPHLGHDREGPAVRGADPDVEMHRIAEEG